MTEEEAWLNKNTGYCQSQLSWLSKAQCKASKQAKRFACESCKGGLVEMGNKPEAKICASCGEVKKIHGYGDCAKCLYKKYGKAMRPPKASDTGIVVINHEPVETEEGIVCAEVVAQKPKGSVVLEDDVFTVVIDPDVKLALMAAEVTDKDINNLLRAKLKKAGWL